KYEREYYFKGSRLVSPVFFHTRNWSIEESEFFSFRLSDRSYFNRYAANRLDDFVEEVLEKLGASGKEKRALRKNKIIYVLARDGDEIERLTGSHARGIYLPAYDYVVTSFICHYHELVHLLVNYRLKSLPVITHPFLQEGLAVALGGRGGKEPGVILDLGYFLFRAGIVELESLLDRKGFFSQDASLSYPACGLYNRFLLEELGPARYLELYLRYSRRMSRSPDHGREKIPAGDLPSSGLWRLFLDRYSQFEDICFKGSGKKGRALFSTDKASVYDAGESYCMELGSPLTIPGSGKLAGCRSSLFEEMAGEGQRYKGEKYLVAANGEEIGVYNLWTGTLAANFVSSFSWPPRSIPCREGTVRFFVHKRVFDEPLEGVEGLE
ncbi:MAG: hypothetical protein U9N45_02165, partial [Gemmatimonadota bacterium]|nr:hypothetical protein [Gemmatimonadota bacterium]